MYPPLNKESRYSRKHHSQDPSGNPLAWLHQGGRSQKEKRRHRQNGQIKRSEWLTVRLQNHRNDRTPARTAQAPQVGRNQKGIKQLTQAREDIINKPPNIDTELNHNQNSQTIPNHQKSNTLSLVEKQHFMLNKIKKR